MIEEDNDLMPHEEQTNDEVNYNFKWMLILLLVGIVGSFIFASVMK